MDIEAAINAMADAQADDQPRAEQFRMAMTDPDKLARNTAHDPAPRRYYTQAVREGDTWTARACEVGTHRVVAVCTSTRSAREAEQMAASHAGVEWMPKPKGSR
jgi:hypothetical protein